MKNSGDRYDRTRDLLGKMYISKVCLLLERSKNLLKLR